MEHHIKRSKICILGLSEVPICTLLPHFQPLICIKFLRPVNERRGDILLHEFAYLSTALLITHTTIIIDLLPSFSHDAKRTKSFSIFIRVR